MTHKVASCGMTSERRGLIPASEPYSALGYGGAFNAHQSTVSNVLAVSGPDAIVDWVMVEMRDGINPRQVLYSQAALLQRDGDVVGLDGISSLSFRL